MKIELDLPVKDILHLYMILSDATSIEVDETIIGRIAREIERNIEEKCEGPVLQKKPYDPKLMDKFESQVSEKLKCIKEEPKKKQWAPNSRRH